MGNKLFVGNLSWDTVEETLKKAFGEYGTVEEAVIIKDKFSGRSKGFGFVTMSSKEEADAAMAGLDNSEVDGREIKVSPARPPKNDYGDRE